MCGCVVVLCFRLLGFWKGGRVFLGICVSLFCLFRRKWGKGASCVAEKGKGNRVVENSGKMEG